MKSKLFKWISALVLIVGLIWFLVLPVIINRFQQGQIEEMLNSARERISQGQSQFDTAMDFLGQDYAVDISLTREHIKQGWLSSSFDVKAILTLKKASQPVASARVVAKAVAKPGIWINRWYDIDMGQLTIESASFSHEIETSLVPEKDQQAIKQFLSQLEAKLEHAQAVFTLRGSVFIDYKLSYQLPYQSVRTQLDCQAIQGGSAKQDAIPESWIKNIATPKQMSSQCKISYLSKTGRTQESNCYPGGLCVNSSVSGSSSESQTRYDEKNWWQSLFTWSRNTTDDVSFKVAHVKDGSKEMTEETMIYQYPELNLQSPTGEASIEVSDVYRGIVSSKVTLKLGEALGLQSTTQLNEQEQAKFKQIDASTKQVRSLLDPYLPMVPQSKIELVLKNDMTIWKSGLQALQEAIKSPKETVSTDHLRLIQQLFQLFSFKLTLETKAGSWILGWGGRTSEKSTSDFKDWADFFERGLEIEANLVLDHSLLDQWLKTAESVGEMMQRQQEVGMAIKVFNHVKQGLIKEGVIKDESGQLSSVVTAHNNKLDINGQTKTYTDWQAVVFKHLFSLSGEKKD